MRTALTYVGLFVLLTACLFPVRNTGVSWQVLLATSAVGAALLVVVVATASRAKKDSRLGRLVSRFLDDE
jgi:peptidoglycan/LPS O-acetylase OafA/YrhL